jgi:hypothetical protein
MESGVMASERKLVRKLSLDWLNHLHGIATSSMRPSFTLFNSHLMLLPWKVHPSLNDAK